MTFLSPLLLLWLIPIVGTILLLYLLKMKRVEVRVPAVFLWPKNTADVRANAPIQRLRFSWLLVLQLIAAVLIVLALSNPAHKVKGLNGKSVAIVLDASASMGATDSPGSRFEEAKSKILAQIDSLSDGDRCAFIESGVEPKILFPLSADHAGLRAAVSRASRTDSSGSMGDALRLASALVGQRASGRIVVYSDGAFPEIKDFSPGKADLVYVKLGTSSKNGAVVALEATSSDTGDAQVFASLHNYDTEPMQTTVVLTADNVLVDARKLIIPAGQSLPQEFRVPHSTQKVTVRLKSPGDILAADDQATIFLQGASAVRTLLVSSGNLFLEKALALEPYVKLDRSATVPPNEVAGASGPSPYDLVIFDGATPAPVRAPAVWSFAGVGPGFGVRQAGISQRPHVVSWNRTNSILRFMDLQDVLIEKGTRIQTLPEGRVLVTGSDGPMMVQSDSDGQRSLFVGWSLLDSDFPLRLAFPIFVDNAVTWLTRSGSGGVGGGVNVRPGQSFMLSAPGDHADLALHGPGATVQPLQVNTGGVTVRGTDRVGEYEVVGANYHKDIAVNILDADESNIAPRDFLHLAGTSVAAKQSFTSLSELWRPVLLITLLLLSAEWWLFVRKS